jgi:hypothetical protein
MTKPQGIDLPDDDLCRLEKRFGPNVRSMGFWNSDGTFGYSNIPLIAVEKAAETLGDQALDDALSRLREMTDRTTLFVELLESFGPRLIERIATAYRDCCLELMVGTRPLRKPSVQETRPLVVACS